MGADAATDVELRGADIVASDWNNRIRDTVIKLSGKIPQVGAVVGILIGFFWPQSKVDIFQAIKDEITNLVRQEILAYELNLHQSEIDALKVTIQRYEAAMNNEKGNFLSIWISQADRLCVIFRQSENNIHLIQLVITLALLHLSALRERLDFGKELYNEDNTQQWKADLEEMYKLYIVDFLPAIYKTWKEWRANQVEISAWVETYPTAIPPFFRQESHAKVVDKLSGETKNFSADLSNNTDTFSQICQAHKTRMCNDAYSDMAGSISATFSFLDILPDNAKNFPKYDNGVFGQMFKGPYSLDLYYSDRSFGLGNPVPIFRIFPTHNDYTSSSGPITNVIIREWNSVDAMQFIYQNRGGTMAGNAQGGMRHDVNVSDKLINGFHLGFSSGVLTRIKIDYYDGTSSETYGNRGGWPISEYIVKGPTLYKVSSWSYKVDYGPSNTFGPSVIQLQYAPQVEP